MPLDSRRRYDVVCANLVGDLLIGEAEKIRNRLKPGGNLLVAGILRREFAGVRKNLQKFRLTLHEFCVDKEWKSGRFALKRDRCEA
jgi:ribosomal protein L11 methyltransferase